MAANSKLTLIFGSGLRQRCLGSTSYAPVRLLGTAAPQVSYRTHSPIWTFRSAALRCEGCRTFSVPSMLAERHGKTPQSSSSVKPAASTTAGDSSSPQTRHWSDTEPLDPSHLVNPNGRMYSVRPRPDPDSATTTTISDLGPLSSTSSFDADTLDSSEEEAIRYQNARRPSILWAVIFVVAAANLTYVGAAVYSYHETHRIADQVKEGGFSVFGSLLSFIGAEDSVGVDERRLRAAKRHDIAEQWGMKLEWLAGWCDQLAFPQPLKEFVMTMAHMGAESYVELPESKRVLVPVIAANSAVFLLWTVARRGRLHRMLNSHFVHTPSSRRFHPLLTSVFSHQSIIHFGCNNLVLWSFGGGALLAPIFLAHYSRREGRVAEASLTPHFLAFFVVAGLSSSLVSHVGAATRWYAIARRYGTELAKRTVGRQGGLGASGAIYAVVVMSALSFPDNRIGILFLPFFSLPIAQGVLALIAIDVLGLVRGWMMFDHLAHLGGAAFGALYWRYGADVWELTKRLVEDEEKNLAVRERDWARAQRHTRDIA